MLSAATSRETPMNFPNSIAEGMTRPANDDRFNAYRALIASSAGRASKIPG